MSRLRPLSRSTSLHKSSALDCITEKYSSLYILRYILDSPYDEPEGSAISPASSTATLRSGASLLR